MLDDIDYEAMREGLAMVRSRSYAIARNSRVIILANNRKSVPKVEELDILSVLNVVQGPFDVGINQNSPPGTPNRV